MKKIYKCFVSSTFEDLEEERQMVYKALLARQCLPVGMENFSADPDSQWKYITETIDDCDYFILIVAHRYGSLDKSGKSFTEKETRYAKSKGIPVLAFQISPKVKNWPHERYDTDSENKEKLKRFLKWLKKEKLIDFWENKFELEANVGKALASVIERHPMPGYVRDISREESMAVSREEPVFFVEFQGKMEIKLDLSSLPVVESIEEFPMPSKYSLNVPPGLEDFITIKDIEKWNDSFLDNIQATEEKNLEVRQYNAQKAPVNLPFIVWNKGSCEANGVAITMEFPNWLKLYDKDVGLKKPKSPEIIDPVKRAMEQKADQFIMDKAEDSKTESWRPNRKKIASFPKINSFMGIGLDFMSSTIAHYKTRCISKGYFSICNELYVLPPSQPCSGILKLTCYSKELPQPQEIEIPISIS